ncbi:MAG: family 20 glycosylhydrolase [Promethearchaeota archaeon]
MKIIPKPREFQLEGGELRVTNDMELFHNKFRVKKDLIPLFHAVREIHGAVLDMSPIRDGLLDPSLSDGLFFLLLATKDKLEGINDILAADREKVPDHPEGYFINSSGDYLFLASKGEAGFFYGVQTLIQVVNQVTVVGSLVLPQFTLVDYPGVGVRGFHLDLKLLMHSFKYIRNLVTTLAHYKYNTLLVEYEDKFPYKGPYEVLRHAYCLSDEQVETLKSLCKRNYIELVPLVQTFGHVEFVLRHEEFKHLREVPDLEDGVISYCPLKEESLSTVRDMVQQVARAHPKAKYFHIGADEVYQLGSCPECREYLENHSKSQLYIDFINKVARVVKGEGMTPIMWSDYLIKYPEALDDLDKDIVIMYWVYHCDEDDEARGEALPHTKFFHDRGFKVMGAPSTNSDFTLTIPQYSLRFQNMAVHARNSAEQGSLGVVVTSWPVCGNPYEVQWPGIAWQAQVTWNPGVSHRSDYGEFSDALWCVHFGVEEGNLLHAFPLVDALVETTAKVNADNYAEKFELVPPLQEKLDSMVGLARKNRATIVALIHGLEGLLVQATFHEVVKCLEAKLAELDEGGGEVTEDDKAHFKKLFEDFLLDVDAYYESSRKLYEDTNIVLEGQMSEVYELDRFFKRMKVRASSYIEKIEELPQGFEELLLELYRGSIGADTW